MFKYALLVVLLVGAFAEEEVEVEEGVLVGTSKNFDQIVKGNEFVLAEFCKY